MYKKIFALSLLLCGISFISADDNSSKKHFFYEILTQNNIPEQVSFLKDATWKHVVDFVEHSTLPFSNSPEEQVNKSRALLYPLIKHGSTSEHDFSLLYTQAETENSFAAQTNRNGNRALAISILSFPLRSRALSAFALGLCLAYKQMAWQYYPLYDMKEISSEQCASHEPPYTSKPRTTIDN